MTTKPLLHATGRESTQRSVLREELEDLDCPICLEPLNGRSISYHPNGGEKHPTCTPCLEQLIAKKGSASCCPSCRKKLKETTIQEWNAENSHPIERNIYAIGNIFRRTIHHIKNNLTIALLIVAWLILFMIAIIMAAL